MQALETIFQTDLGAPIEKVWQAWADDTKWSAWLSMNISHEFTPGGRYDNGRDEGGQFLEIVPLKKISFTWEMKRYQPGSFVELEFEEVEAAATRLTLVHRNLQTQNDLHDAELGWKWSLASLQSFLEKGKPISWEEWETKKTF